MDKLTFKLKNLSLEQDDYGQHLIVKMVQIYKDGKFWRNAKINADLMDTLVFPPKPVKPISPDHIIGTVERFDIDSIE